MAEVDDYSYGSRYTENSYKPPTPGLPADENSLPLPAYNDQKPPTTGSSIAPSELANVDPSTISHEFLEEKRRRALREREREQAAKQRQRELLAQKREMELKKRLEDDNLRREQEAAAQSSIEREDKERETKRLEQMRRKEEEVRKEEEEKRKMAITEKKREQSLRQIEMQRLREEETQRMKRELILNKRKEMERVRDQAERLYAEKKKEEVERKLSLVDEMKRKREQRLIDLEKRRNNPLLVQQEREFNQLIELQASVGRLQSKLEESQARREDVRERLLEARHVVEMLEIEERQVGISIEEVESDLKKLKGYQDGLSRLVSTRYDDDEYEKSVILIQKIYRGRKDWKIGKKLKEEKQARELEDAAIKIQKIQRGRRIRIMQKDDAMVKSAVRIQSQFRGWKSRKDVQVIRSGLQAKMQHEYSNAVVLQSAFRNFLARRTFQVLKEENLQKKLVQQQMREMQKTEQAGKRIGRGQVGKKGGKGGRAPSQLQKERSKEALVRRERSKDALIGREKSKGALGNRERSNQTGAQTERSHRAGGELPERGMRAGAQTERGREAPGRREAVAAVRKQVPEKKKPDPRPQRTREPVPSGQIVRKEERRIGGELGRIYASTPRGGPLGVGGNQNPRARRFVPTAATAAAAQTAEELGGFSFIRSGVQNAYGDQTVAGLPEVMQRPEQIQGSIRRALPVQE